MPRRDKLQIRCDLLQELQDASGTLKPTHLMYGANLNHSQLKKYTSELLEGGFIESVSKNGSTVFRLTGRGRKYLAKIREMREFEDTFDL